MTIIVNIKPGSFKPSLCRQAAAHGVDIGAYAASLLEEATHMSGTKPFSPSQLEDALRELAEFSDKIPLLPQEAFSRESLYQDHD